MAIFFREISEQTIPGREKYVNMRRKINCSEVEKEKEKEEEKREIKRKRRNIYIYLKENKYLEEKRIFLPFQKQG